MRGGLLSAKRMLLFALALLLVAVAVTLTRRARSASEKRLPGASSQLASAPSSSEVSYKQYVRVWVHADGISSDVARVRPGRVILVAENLTHCDINLALDELVAGQAGQT